MMEPTNGYHEDRKMIETRLEALEVGQKETNKRLSQIEVTLALVNQKAGMYGAIGGAIGGGLIVELFRRVLSMKLGA